VSTGPAVIDKTSPQAGVPWVENVRYLLWVQEVVDSCILKRIPAAHALIGVTGGKRCRPVVRTCKADHGQRTYGAACSCSPEGAGGVMVGGGSLLASQ